MSSNDDYLTDDYVAELLATEAKDANLKYSAMGVDAFKPSRRPTAKLKPNTRFLQTLLKGTESHNTALLAKEAVESQARLQELSATENARRKRYKPEATDIRKRQLGDIKSILGGRPAKRARDQAVAPMTLTTTKDEPSKDTRDTHRGHRNEKAGSESEPRQIIRRGSEEDGSEADRDQSRRHRNKRRHSNSEEDPHRYHRRSKVHHRSRSPRSRERRHRDRSPGDRDAVRNKEHRCHGTRDADSHRRRDRSRDKCDRRSKATNIFPTTTDLSDESDSDMIGPAPPPKSPVRRRGRGAVASASGIDRRFSASYDPKADVDTGRPDQDKWDDTVEAYRERLKWKEKGAERLREAGLSEPDITKWENGGERRPEDVRWTKKGEKREWDRGKVVGPDGSVSVNSDWAEAGGNCDS